MLMQTLDYVIIAAFFALMFGIAAACSRRAGSSAGEFFLSGRSMPWWLIGFSMAAAATSSNSASMFTEFVREGGMSRMWKWWAFLLTGMTTVFIYSKLWVRSGAKSDIEFYELRYSGKPAAFLRGFRAIYLGLVFNAITTAWCILPAVKMGQVLFNVDQWTIIWVCCVASIVYSALGGFRGAIITDFFLFLIILAGAFAIMYFAWQHPAVGGFSKMMAHPTVQSHLSFFPSFADTDTLIAVFVIPIAIQWWNVWYPGSEPGGGGYIVHRMLTARNENHCQAGTILFLVMNYVVRPWPWYLAAFATLIIFPDLESLKTAFPHISESMVKGDLAYPALFKFIPNGWLGLVVASMLGALFSTVAAHLSMGSNYIANDVWKRFVRPQCGERELVVVRDVELVRIQITVERGIRLVLTGDQLGIFALEATTHRTAVDFDQYRALLIDHVFAVDRAVFDTDRIRHLAGILQQAGVADIQLGHIAEIVVGDGPVVHFVFIVFTDGNNAVLAVA